jgi:hypothetical protein
VRPLIKILETQALLCAPAPVGVLEGSRADVSFAAGLLIDKYVECRYRHSRYYAAVRTMQVNSVQSSKNTGFTSVYSVSSSA